MQVLIMFFLDLKEQCHVSFIAHDFVCVIQ